MVADRSWAAKRTFDVAASLFGLIVTSPVLAAVALKIRLLDRDGPALYSGVRVGRNRREFRMYKFRSMVTDADRVGGPNTSSTDARITSTGGFLRRFKLDELPQLYNVLRGDMSLVGPRPEVPSQVAKWTDQEQGVLQVRPGITDWASLRFHNEGEILRDHADPDRAYDELIRPEKLQLGLKYVEAGTFRDDLTIIWRTATLFRRGSAETRSTPSRS